MSEPQDEQPVEIEHAVQDERRRLLEAAGRLAVGGPLLAVLLDPRKVQAYGGGTGDEGPVDP